MSIRIKTSEEIETLRVAGRLAAEVLEMIEPYVIAGVTTEELDRICHDYMVDVQGVIPAPLNYKGFPKSICTSVNAEVVHGIPGDRVLEPGDALDRRLAVVGAEEDRVPVEELVAAAGPVVAWRVDPLREP